MYRFTICRISANERVFGIIRVELIEYNAIKREKHLVKSIEDCNSRVYEFKLLEAKNKLLIQRIDELEVKINAYELAIFSFIAGKIDTAVVCELYIEQFKYKPVREYIILQQFGEQFSVYKSGFKTEKEAQKYKNEHLNNFGTYIIVPNVF